jgi:hypothetical protein
MKYVSGRDIMLGRQPQLDVGTLQKEMITQ